MNPEPRYRMLNPGEVILPGDECKGPDNQWTPVGHSLGDPMNHHFFGYFRRKQQEKDIWTPPNKTTSSH